MTGIALGIAVASPPAIAQEHDHDESHEHADGPRHLAHGPDGFPEFVDIFFTHHAYLERKVHPRFAATAAEAANEYEESAELAWEFAPRFGVEIAAPFVHTDPEEGDGASGFGDLEVAAMAPLVIDPERLLIVTARSGFVLPTGDEDDGLGIDGWGWEPGLLVWKGFGAEKRGALQAELTYDRLFADEGDDEEGLVYNLGLSWWLPSNWIPIVELNGFTRLGSQEEEHGHEEEHAGLFPAGGALVPAHGDVIAGEDDTLISATLGFRYAFANGQQWGGGVQLPFGDTEAYDVRVVVGGIIHLD